MSEHLVRKSILKVADTKSLAEFAGEVERRLAKGKNAESVERIVCRLLTNKDPRIAALMVCKWVEWRYGKPKDPDSGAQGFAIQIINHIPRPGEASEITNETSETKIIQAEPKSKQ